MLLELKKMKIKMKIKMIKMIKMGINLKLKTNTINLNFILKGLMKNIFLKGCKVKKVFTRNSLKKVPIFWKDMILR